MGIIVGITGCIGSGKNFLCDLFSQKGFKEIDVDTIGKSVLQTPFIKEKLKLTFPPSIFDQHQNVLPKNLGSVVFQDSRQLKILNQIMHPFMKKEIIKLLEENPHQNFVIHAALLFQMNLETLCHISLFLEVQKSILIKRASERNHYLSKEELEKLIEQQKKTNHYHRNADIIINNNFGKEKLIIKFNRLYSLFKDGMYEH